MALQLKWDARPLPARCPPAARRTDNFSKSDNNTLRQILAEGKKLSSKAEPWGTPNERCPFVDTEVPMFTDWYQSVVYDLNRANALFAPCF